MGTKIQLGSISAPGTRETGVRILSGREDNSPRRGPDESQPHRGLTKYL